MTSVLDKRIEGLLFYFGEEVRIRDLATYTEVSEDEVREALERLKVGYTDRGFELMVHNDKASLVTSSEVSSLIQSIEQKELEGELSKAAQEVLAIVLYGGPISKGYIDYIRGVNSTVSIRNLVARGLIERTESGRGTYVTTHAFLQSLGVADVQSIPEYEAMRIKVTGIMQHSKKES